MHALSRKPRSDNRQGWGEIPIAPATDFKFWNQHSSAILVSPFTVRTNKMSVFFISFSFVLWLWFFSFPVQMASAFHQTVIIVIF